MKQCSSHHRCRGQKKSFTGFVGFGEDVVLVVEVVELLRELESIFCRVRRLGGGDALQHDVRELAGTQP